MNDTLTNTKKRTRIFRWLGTILSFVLLIFLFQRQGWDEITDAFQQVSGFSFGIGVVLIFVSRFAVVGRWHSLLRSVERVSLYQTARITFAGLFASNFLPTTVGGDVVRFAGAVQQGISGVTVAASLVVDRLIGMLGMIFALPFGARPLFQWLSVGRAPQAGIVTGVSIPWIDRLWEKGAVLLKKLVEAVKVWSKHPQSLLISLGCTFIHMLCTFGSMKLLFNDMGEQLPFSMVAGLWSFVYFVTLLPVSINGFGVQEISIAFIFSEVGGVSLQHGLTVSVIFRTLMMIGSLPGVFFVPGIIAGKGNKGGES